MSDAAVELEAQDAYSIHDGICTKQCDSQHTFLHHVAQ
jgi:hypothetical protein